METVDNAAQADVFYQQVLDSLPNQVAVVDRAGHTRFSNAAWRAHFEGVVAPEAEGLMREGRYLEACEAALTGQTGASADSLGLMRDYLAALRDIIGGVRDEFCMDYEVPGQGRWFRVRVTRSRSGNGDTVIQRENITVEKHAERGAENTRRFLQSLIDLLPTRILWKDIDGRILGANRAFLDDAGVADVIGRTDLDLRWGPRDGARIQAEDQRVMEGGVPDFNQVREMPWPDGPSRWFRIDRMPLLRRDGTTSGILIAYADITNLKRTEDALARQTAELKISEQESQRRAERLDLAARAAGIGVWDQDLRTGQSYWDARMREIHGLTPELPNEGIDRDLMARLCHPEDRDHLRTAIQTAMATGDHFEADFRVIRGDGGERHVDVRAIIHRDAQGKPVRIIGITMDVTERNRLLQERQQAQRLEAIGQLAAGIAHEINTPTQYIGDNTRFIKESFAGVLGLLDLMRGSPPPTPEELEAAWSAADAEYLRTEIPRAIEQSLEGINRVAGIVRAMRDFSHPATDRMAHDLNRAIQSTLAVATNEWRYVAEVVTDLDPALPRVPVMPGEFNQVILNMVVNAAHAIAAARGPDSPGKGRITITTSLGGDHAIITIADNGCGMSAEVQKRIFEPFFTTKGVGEGTGQGLALTHNFIARHGGTISVQSAPGNGAQFTIRLPVTVAATPQPVA
ncbi:MAG: PAS domain-containing protein [Gammaproteobacteria bacterium]